MKKTYAFHVNGLHCHSCVILTEGELEEVGGVSDATTSLEEKRVEVTGEFGEKSQEELMVELNEKLKPHGYALSLERAASSAKWDEFAYALPISLLFVAAFLLLQKLDVVNLVNTADFTYGTAFAIGLVASVSTCMAVVGGIALSLSANCAKEGYGVRPQAMFHVARLGAFFVLGGLIGALGSVFRLEAAGMLAVGLVAALALLVLGINLLDVFPLAKRLQPIMPAGLGSCIRRLKNSGHSLAAPAVGIATFFLPCGFTQSMQVYTLTTGGFLKGGLTMLAFALGTFPVLALLSFSSAGIQNKIRSGIFFKAAGLVVIFFATFNLINALAGAGIIDPVFTL